MYTPGYASLSPSPPSSYLAFFSSTSSWTGGAAPISANVSNAAAYIAKSYLRLEEVNITGSVLQVVELSSLRWILSPVVVKDGLSSAVFTGTIAGNSAFSVKLVAVISDVVGVLKTGIVMTPKTFEMAVEIYNFPYLNPSDSVSLTVGIVTATANISTNATVTVNANSSERYQYGANQSALYFDLALTALCDGETKSITLYSSTGVLADFNNSGIQAQVQSMVNAGINVVIKKIVFPPGAINITYDPTMGIGSGPTAKSVVEEGLSKSMIAWIFVGILCGVFIIAALACYLFRNARKNRVKTMELEKSIYSSLE